MIRSVWIFQNIGAVEISKEGQGFLFRKIMQFRETENLARAVIFPRFIHRISVGKFGRREIIMFIQVGDDFFKVDGLRGGFELV